LVREASKGDKRLGADSGNRVAILEEITVSERGLNVTFQHFAEVSNLLYFALCVDLILSPHIIEYGSTSWLYPASLR
jgi:hypothetical protein